MAEVDLYCQSHAGLGARVPEEVAVVMFNLGYLPGGQHEVITTPEETLAGLRASWERLRAGGVITVVCYPGHPGGELEAEAVVAWAADLGAPARVVRFEVLGTSRPAPFLVAVSRRGGAGRPEPEEE